MFGCLGVQGVQGVQGVEGVQKHGLCPFRCLGVLGLWFRCLGVQLFRCSSIKVFWCSGCLGCLGCLGVQVFKVFKVNDILEGQKKGDHGGGQKMAKIQCGVKPDIIKRAAQN